MPVGVRVFADPGVRTRREDARGLAVCIPEAPEDDLPRVPIIDLKSGYVLRSVDALPKQGAVAPWRLHQNYIKDVRLLRRGRRWRGRG